VRSIPNRLDAAFTHAEAQWKQFYQGLSIDERVKYTLRVLNGTNLERFEASIRSRRTNEQKLQEFMAPLYATKRSRRSK